MNSENKEVFDKCNSDFDEVINVNKDIESVMAKVKAAWNDLKYTDSPSAKTVIVLSKREVASILYSVEEVKSIANDSRIASAKAMKEDGLTNSEIAKRLGLPNESSVRSLLNTNEEAKSIHEAAADIDEDQEYKDA